MGTIGMTFVLATQSLSDFEKTWIAAATWATGAVVDIMIAVSLTMSYIKYRREAIKCALHHSSVYFPPLTKFLQTQANL
jgi:hypothetical protein